MSIFSLILTLLAALVLPACTQSPSEPELPLVEIRFDADLEHIWQKAIEHAPLPEGFEYLYQKNPNDSPDTDTPDRNIDTVIEIIAVDWNRGAPGLPPVEEDGSASRINLSNSGGSPEKESIQALSDYILLSREYFAPRRLLWEHEQDISFSTPFPEEVFPLGKIKLPYRALSVDGLYPDDEKYPLKMEKYLTITGKTSGMPEEWEPWLERVNRSIAVERLSEPRIIRIGAVGDIMMQRGVEATFFRYPDGLERIFTDTLPVLQSQDFLIGNLEGAVTLRGTPFPKTFTFRFNPRSLEYLKRAGFDYLSVTNNHAYDYGETGFIDTLDYLEEYGIATSGAGRSREEAEKPYVRVINDRKFSVLSLGAFPRERTGFDGRRHAMVTEERVGILYWGPESEQAIIRAFSGNDSFNIIKVHGGIEWQNRPSSSQKELYRHFISLGADLVLGSHPHVRQGMEAIDGKLIVYSLGNFIFPGMGGMTDAEDTMVLSLGIYDGEIRYVVPSMVKIDHIPVRIDHSDASISRFLSLTEELNQYEHLE